MPLTKIRPPVSEISQMASGTTNIDIPNAGGNVGVTVAGVSTATLASTTWTLADTVNLIAKQFTGELINVATTSGAAGKLETTAALMQLLGTTIHPVILGANNVQNLTLQTDGRVTLNTQGNTGTQLIDKAYVDAALATVPTTATDLIGVLADPGSIQIPTSTGNLILNWGSNGNVLNGSTTPVTFNLAFPNAFLAGFAVSSTAANHDGTLSVITPSTTQMSIYSSLDKTSGFYWFAIGY